MAAPGTIRGALGQVKYAYQTAAFVTAYEIARDEFGHWVLTGNVQDPDAYLLGQAPLIFVQVVKGGAWKWPVESWHVAGGRCYARLGPLQPS